MKTLFKIIIGLPVLSTFLIGVVFLCIGVYETVLGIIGILTGQMHTEATPGITLFQALDVFLIGFLFLIFSIGFAQLFMPKPSKIATVLNNITPEWLKVKNFTQLKLILWDTVLTTLVVIFVGDAFKAGGVYNWELTIIPIAILLISFSKFLIKKLATP